MGITALISAIFGLLSPVVPEAMKIFRDAGDHKREMEMLRLQSELQLKALEKQASMKIEEAGTALAVTESETYRDSLTAIIKAQSRKTGFAWIDALNAVLRPVCAVLIIALFVVIALGFSNVIPQDQFAPLYVVATEGVIGFLFGNRSYVSIRNGALRAA